MQIKQTDRYVSRKFTTEFDPVKTSCYIADDVHVYDDIDIIINIWWCYIPEVTQVKVFNVKTQLKGDDRDGITCNIGLLKKT